MGYTDEVGVQLPPLHPRCRCAIVYREVPVDRLLSPTKPTSTPVSSPLNDFKAFSEFKMYWAENYNVKISDAVGALHFGSVRTACAGVEAVIKEFPKSRFNLKEIGTYHEGLMSISNNFSKINFNPQYFSSPQRLVKTFETGYYIKNMSTFGAGAHEAGHLIEKWLKDTQNISAQEVIWTAYGAAVRANGFKPLEAFKKEISSYSCKNAGECLAEAVADCVVNGHKSATLSKFIWQVLKGELKMVAYDEMEMSKFSFEEIEKYARYDNFGCLIGMSDDAPEELKTAYEADEKKIADLAAKGIIV